MQALSYYIKNPTLFFDSVVKKAGAWLPDRIYIKLRYRFQMGKRLDLKNPKTFQEKIQWLKLYDRKPLYAELVDKVKVKEYIAKQIGVQYVIPLLGIWDRPEDIEWGKLPDRFVLKTNHGGGSMGIVICRDKSFLDRQKTIEKLNASLKHDVYKDLREWPYKNVEKKVFAEELVETDSETKDLPDYKWYCFNGEPLFCQVIQDRNIHETIDFFDIHWNHQEFIGLNPNAIQAAEVPERPAHLETQLQLAKMLSKNIPFSRIDLYETKDNPLFGEITFYPASGFGNFRPQKWEIIVGDYLDLSKVKKVK